MRRRERPEQIQVFPIYVGVKTFDFTPPYGDGPWTNPSIVNFGSSSWPSAATFSKVCVDELHAGPPYRTGGPLNIVEFSTDQYEPKAYTDISSGMYRYSGHHMPITKPSSALGWNTLAEFETADVGNVEAYGAIGWNRFRPTKPIADLGVFLGEFRDIPRTLKGTAKAFHNLWRTMGGSMSAFAPKHVASNWLNTQFGWLPFLNDLRKFHKLTVSLDERLKRLRRNNGRWERRGGTVQTTSELQRVHEFNNTVGLWPGLTTKLYTIPLQGYWHMDTFTTNSTWFEGAFRYWIPGKPDNWYWRARATAMLYGLTPVPSLIWELTPWSWLIDWWSNAGDCIANISSMMLDNLCAKYAYIMGTTEYTSVYTGKSVYVTGSSSKASWKASYTRKHRIAASPFGFGLTGDDFSLRQWSILGALGLTRLL